MDNTPAIRGGVVDDDADYRALLARLDEEFPTVSSGGFDFSKIRGLAHTRTAKAIILHLSLVGWSPEQIGEAIAVPPDMVQRYLHAVMSEAAPVEDVEALREIERRKLTVYERASWEEFERGCQRDDSNPAWIRVLLEIAKRRASLDGLDRPTRVSIDKTERKLVVTEIVVKSAAEARAMKQLPSE
jgi:hypothetical protein